MSEIEIVKGKSLVTKPTGLSISSRKWHSSKPLETEVLVIGQQNLKDILIAFKQTQEKDGFIPECNTNHFLKHCTVYIDGAKISHEKWERVYPTDKTKIHVYIGARGGDNGVLKTVIGVVIMVAAVIASPYTFGGSFSAAMAANSSFLGLSYGTFFAMGASLFLGGISSMLFPQAMPSLPNADNEQSNAYSLTGSNNSANPDGFIPVILGRHKATPPLFAKSWTKWEGEIQYFNMLVCWGQSDVEVTDFKIGDTPLEDFANVKHIFHQSSTGDNLELFSKTYNERSVGAILTHSTTVDDVTTETGWITRTVGEANDLSIDIQFGGLYYIDSGSGNVYETSVEFEIEYKSTSSDEWLPLYGNVDITGKSFKLRDSRHSYLQSNNFYVNLDGTITNQYGYANLYPTKDPRILGCEASTFTTEEEQNSSENSWLETIYHIDFADGQLTNTNYIFKNDKIGLKIFTIRKTGLPLDNYEMRIKRITPDSTSQYVQNEATWATMRAIKNTPAFNTPVPWCVSELQIQASEQLSGYVQDFNAIVHSKCRDYDEATDSWIYRTTNNPASLALYMLTDRHGLNKPFLDRDIDFETFKEFHKYCADNEFTFNFICDSEVLLWERLVQIMATGHSAPTRDVDGKWGVVIDRSDKEVKQLFTSRNSWGMSVSRTFQDLPHALRVSFINEENNYLPAEQYIFWDGYNLDGSDGKEMATDIIAWEYKGVTNWNALHKLGRYHLAKMLHRQLAISINTDWEWLAVNRGNLVGLAHDVLLNTFGQGYIVGLIYEVDGEQIIIIDPDTPAPKDENGVAYVPIGLQLDETIIFDDVARYGIAVRYIDKEPDSFEIIPEYDGEEHQNLYFMYELSPNNIPKIGDLCAVSLLGQEYEKYLVAGIQPSDRATAEITLIPYAMPEIEMSANAEIPPYNPSIILPVISQTELPFPTILSVVSDESAMIYSQGIYIIRLKAYVKFSGGAIDTRNIVLQLEGVNTVTNETITGLSDRGENFVFAQNVHEGDLYIVRVRLVDALTGKTSRWSDTVEHVVVGRTTPPPNVQGFYAEIDNPLGVKLSWNKVDVIDVIKYRISGASNIESTTNSITSQDLKGKTGLLEFSVQAVDLIGLVSPEPTKATITVNAPTTPEIEVSLETDGLMLNWDDCQTTWEIMHYILKDVYTQKTVKIYTEQFKLSPRPYGQYNFEIEAVDIFGNSSGKTTKTIDIPDIEPPEPILEIIGGVLRIKWSDVVSPFPIDVYKIYNENEILLHTTKATFYDAEADPNNTSGSLTYLVKAVDTAGNESDFGYLSQSVTAPTRPVVTISVIGEKRNIDVKWTTPSSIMPIMSYDVIRQYEINGIVQEENLGSYDTTAITIEPLTKDVDNGTHTILVRAVNSLGQKSLFAEAEIKINAPSKVFINGYNVDNNVFLSWVAPSTFTFAIREYLVFSYDDNDLRYLSEIGRIDSLFFGIIEENAGIYNYAIQAVDWAGNLGEINYITINVDEPPNFVLYDDKTSTFNGTKTNFILDGAGGMIGAVPRETWADNIHRITGGSSGGADINTITWSELLTLAGLPTTATWQQLVTASGLGDNATWQDILEHFSGGEVPELSWQEKIDMGYDYFFSPETTSGTYIEVVDIGAVIAGTRINAIVSSENLEGSPVLSCKIETSSNNSTWTTVTADGFSGYGSNFRYVRYTFTVTGGLMRISNINYKLSVKQKLDSGVVYYNSSLGMTGVQVDFTVSFLDVKGIPMTTVSESTFDNPLTAYVIFEDEPNPTGFKVFVLDKNGNPTNGTVTWSANGV